MIADALKQALKDLWSGALYYLSGQFLHLDPVWHWAWYAFLVIAALLAIAWFFGDWIKPLKPIIGGAILAILFALFAYRKGENEARAHDAAKAKPAAKPKPAESKKPWNPFASIIVFAILLALGRGAAACPSYDTLRAKLQEDGSRVEMTVLMGGKAALFVRPDGTGAIAIAATCSVMVLDAEHVAAIKARLKEIDGQES